MLPESKLWLISVCIPVRVVFRISDLMKEHPIIWTIGHSTRTFESFAGLLHAAGIEVVADIRLYPGSRRFPHFRSDERTPDHMDNRSFDPDLRIIRRIIACCRNRSCG